MSLYNAAEFLTSKCQPHDVSSGNRLLQQSWPHGFNSTKTIPPFFGLDFLPSGSMSHYFHHKQTLLPSTTLVSGFQTGGLSYEFLGVVLTIVSQCVSPAIHYLIVPSKIFVMVTGFSLGILVQQIALFLLIHSPGFIHPCPRPSARYSQEEGALPSHPDPSVQQRP